MDVPVETQQPLLENAPTPQKTPKTPTQKTIRKAFKGTAHLAKLLPTGTVLIFQILSPVFTHEGQCHTQTSKAMTIGLLTFCSISCFLLSFTDSFRDERGKVRYGMASSNGLWILDASVRLPIDEAAKYRLRFIDFFHAFTSILVFGAIALFDKSVVSCLVPKPSEEAKELLVAVPIGIGLVCSVLFVLFPSQRHGIGFPLSRN
ncbi:protein DMP7-like [Gastrolobium bilobum]|uniref:protein DMP7-like n=1 Tax=Gastrolobium bilobum TaxID=150636 RepID=UPI002AB24B8A|nr:protein DMP7-like [Gastrolobium bilobum]